MESHEMKLLMIQMVQDVALWLAMLLKAICYVPNMAKLFQCSNDLHMIEVSRWDKYSTAMATLQIQRQNTDQYTQCTRSVDLSCEGDGWSCLIGLVSSLVGTDMIMRSLCSRDTSWYIVRQWYFDGVPMKAKCACGPAGRTTWWMSNLSDPITKD